MTKLYLDEDVHEDLAIALRLRGYIRGRSSLFGIKTIGLIL
jgi:hypothetical protein